MTESYKKALKEHYKIEKEGEQINCLVNPTPAGLRDLLLLKMEIPLNDSDKKIIENFLEIPFIELTPKKIRNLTDKFKPLVIFLKGKSEDPDLRRLEMIALILDFKQRPYRKFIKHNNNFSEVEDITANEETNFYEEKPIVESDNNQVEKTKIEEVSDERIEILETEVNTQEITVVPDEEAIKNQRKFPFKKIGIIGILSILIGFSFFMNIKSFTTKECMVWKGDKYEAVDCNEKTNGFVETTLPKDDQLIKDFRKLKVDTKTSFFDKNGNPKIWYVKNPNGTLEFYNQPGLQPETGKTLKPVSRYIIEKYILTQEK